MNKQRVLASVDRLNHWVYRNRWIPGPVARAVEDFRYHVLGWVNRG